MKLVEGPTLADRIRQGPIPMDEALSIARQICEALEYPHERGIVHRDLKTANLPEVALIYVPALSKPRFLRQIAILKQL
jgi:tRNA A-37 threonylcarbamoyl transferase component Bud32